MFETWLLSTLYKYIQIYVLYKMIVLVRSKGTKNHQKHLSSCNCQNPRSHIRCQKTKPLKLNVKELVPLLVLEIFPLPRRSMSVSETTTHQSSILYFIVTSCRNLSYGFALRTSCSRVCKRLYCIIISCTNLWCPCALSTSRPRVRPT